MTIRYIQHITTFLFFSPLIFLILIKVLDLDNFGKADISIFKKIHERSDFCDISLAASNSRHDICHYISSKCDTSKYGLSQIYYCYYSTNIMILQSGLILGLVFVASLIFISFGIITSSHLYPNLETLSFILNIPPKLSGLVLLAIGNAVPDISTLYHSISTNSTPLAIGELLGSCNFILGAVIGSMAILRRFKVNPKVFLKDFIGFSTLVLISLIFLSYSKLRRWECIIMMGLYVVYIWYSFWSVTLDNEDSLEASVTSLEIDNEETPFIDGSYRDTSVESDLTTFYKYTRTPQVLSTLESADMLSLGSGEYIDRIEEVIDEMIDHNVTAEDVPTSKVSCKFLLKYMNFKEFLNEYPNAWQTPIVAIYNIIIPTLPKFLHEGQTDEFEDLIQFKRKLLDIQVWTTPFLILYIDSYNLFGIKNISILVFICLFTTILIKYHTPTDKINTIIPIFGFLTSIMLINYLSSQLVKIIQNLALIFSLSESLLGLTVLSLCNSFGDLVTNLTLSHLNLSLVGISASFGSILIYFGIGIGFNSFLVMWKYEIDFIDLKLSKSFFVSAFGLILLLLVFLIGIPLNKWYMDRKLGALTILIWGSVLVINVYTS